MLRPTEGVAHITRVFCCKFREGGARLVTRAMFAQRLLLAAIYAAAVASQLRPVAGRQGEKTYSGFHNTFTLLYTVAVLFFHCIDAAVYEFQGDPFKPGSLATSSVVLEKDSQGIPMHTKGVYASLQLLICICSIYYILLGLLGGAPMLSW